MNKMTALETLGPLNASAVNFRSEVGHWLSSLSEDPRGTSFLFQRLTADSLTGRTSRRLVRAERRERRPGRSVTRTS